LRVGSLFSGIEGFGLGFEQAGAKIIWQVEQDKFCLAVLERHWPSVQRFTDVCRVGKATLAPVDCITAGVPCQDVSIAGQRKGLKGKRTGLFYEFARILRELRPAWFVFENVPGLFSSNKGRDFAEVLRVLMVECGYGVSWRVLDSRYFNVAQRRERVFIVGCFGKPCPAEILFESESGAGDSAASGEARSDIAVPLTSGSGESRPGRRMEDDWNIVAGSLQSHSKRHGHAMSTQQAVESGQIVSHALGCPTSTGRNDPNGVSESETMYTLSQVDRHAVAFAENQRGELRTSKIAPQLSAGGGKPGSGYSAVAYALREDPGGTGQGHNTNYVVNALSPVPGGPDDNDAQGNHIVSSPADSNGMRDFASLPKGMDSPRYRALGNAVTASVAYFIAKRMMRVARP
jgi:DNA-cytosine methyltransferase